MDEVTKRHFRNSPESKEEDFFNHENQARSIINFEETNTAIHVLTYCLNCAQYTLETTGDSKKPIFSQIFLTLKFRLVLSCVIHTTEFKVILVT